jgi:hypothetical protein
VIRVRRVVTVMIALAGLTVMLLVERRVVIAMTDHVRLIVTLVHHAALIVIRVHLVGTVMIALAGLTVMLLVERRVGTVMIALAGLTVTRVRRVLQHKNVLMKLKAVLANVAQVAKCHCPQSVLAKIG